MTADGLGAPTSAQDGIAWVRCPRHCDGGWLAVDTPVGVTTVACSCLDGSVPREVSHE